MRRYVVLVLVCFLAPEALGQGSQRKAVLLSALLPGFGHHYANNGSWRGMAAYLTLAEAGLWLGIANSRWQRQHAIESYRTYATVHAGASLQGKDRRFLVSLGSYLSSEAYVDALLRQRRWDLVGTASSLEHAWQWRSAKDMQVFQNLRSAADQWGRRSTVFVAMLAANRVLAIVSVLRKTRRTVVSLSMYGPGAVPLLTVARKL